MAWAAWESVARHGSRHDSIAPLTSRSEQSFERTAEPSGTSFIVAVSACRALGRNRSTRRKTMPKALVLVGCNLNSGPAAAPDKTQNG